MPKKILVVDDEHMIVDMLEMRLEAKGYVVSKAYSGSGALEQIEKDIPDLILLDIMMPPPDGLEVCRTIKTNPAYKSIAVIMLTAKAFDDARKASIEAGANEHISKPYDADELMVKIKGLIGE
jgi:two-component system, OmpR family, alkaline phosphatase synthesis response regulator PhoP